MSEVKKKEVFLTGGFSGTKIVETDDSGNVVRESFEVRAPDGSVHRFFSLSRAKMFVEEEMAQVKKKQAPAPRMRMGL